MSRWIDFFGNHAFHNSWKETEVLFEKIEDLRLTDPTALKEFLRLRKVHSYVRDIVSSSDPELVISSTLDNMANTTLTVNAELNNFLNGQNLSHIQNANNFITGVMSYAQSLPHAKINNGRAIAGSVRSFNKTLDNYLEGVKKSTDDQIASVSTTVSNLNVALNDNKTQILAQKTLIEKAQETIQSQSASFAAQLQTQIADHNTQFTSKETERATSFKDTVDRYAGNVNDAIVNINEKTDDRFLKLVDETSAILEVLYKYQDDAKRVLGVVLNTAQAGAYSRYAVEEKKTANIYRIGAIFFFVFGIAFMIVPEVISIYFHLDNGDLSTYKVDWHNSIYRLPFSILLFVPAFYMARESNKHRENEIKNRRLELVLSSIDPYLSLMDKDRQETLKAELAKRLFLEADVSNSKQSSFNVDLSSMPSELIDMIKQFLKKEDAA